MSWRGDSAALACLTFDVDAEAPVLVESGLYARNAGVMSHQAYGPLVGVPRILDLLAEYSLPATFFVPGWTADRYPQVVEAILAAGQEIGHHSYAHKSTFALSEECSQTLTAYLHHPDMEKEVCRQYGVQSAEFLDGELFQPVPYSPNTPHGMPLTFEQYYLNTEASEEPLLPIHVSHILW